MAVGVASPSAHGQAMTSTASAAENARSDVPPGDQPPGGGQRRDGEHARGRTPRRCGRRVAARRPSAPAPARPGGPCRRTGCRRPTAAASTISLPSSTVVPPMTLAPGSTRIGLASPVIALMSTAADPSTTRPSAAIVCPGRTTKRCCSLELVGRDDHLRPVGPQDSDVLRAQRRQRPQRAACL